MAVKMVLLIIFCCREESCVKGATFCFDLYYESKVVWRRFPHYIYLA